MFKQKTEKPVTMNFHFCYVVVFLIETRIHQIHVSQMKLQTFKSHCKHLQRNRAQIENKLCTRAQKHIADNNSSVKNLGISLSQLPSYLVCFYCVVNKSGGQRMSLNYILR